MDSYFAREYSRSEKDAVRVLQQGLNTSYGTFESEDASSVDDGHYGSKRASTWKDSNYFSQSQSFHAKETETLLPSSDRSSYKGLMKCTVHPKNDEFTGLFTSFTWLPMQKGFVKSTLGSGLKQYLICILVVSNFLLALIVLFEIYIPSDRAHVDWDARAINFIIAWILSLWATFNILITCTPNSTFFSLRSELAVSDFVSFEEPKELDEMSGKPKLIEKFGLLSEFWRILHLFLSTKDGNRRFLTVATVFVSEGGIRYFDYHCNRRCYCPLVNRFVDASIQIGKLLKLAEENHFRGLTAKQVLTRREFTGRNVIEYDVESFSQAILNEARRFSFILQASIIWAQLFWRNFLTSTIWAALTVYSSIHKMLITRQNKQDLRAMVLSANTCSVTVIRECCPIVIPAEELVIGDILLLGNSSIVPCDVLILQGQAAVDESSLTGESVPVQKYAISLPSKYVCWDHQSSRASLLSAGTHIVSQFGSLKALGVEVDSCYQADVKGKMVGLAFRTGATTNRGVMLQSIFAAKSLLVKYGQQLPIVFLLLGAYALSCIIVQTFLLGKSSATFFYSLGTISQVTPIWISAILYIGQNVAAQRLLHDNRIYCLDTAKIAICGKVRVLCFDKTGTLTKQRMEFIGVLPSLACASTAHESTTSELILLPQNVSETIVDSSNIKSDTKSKNEILSPGFCLSSKAFCDKLPDMLFAGLSTCHSLVLSDESSVYTGDELEMALFQATCGTVREDKENGWRYFHSDVRRNFSATVMKVFEFDHVRQSMSVIVQNFQTATQKHVGIVFCKGSCEKLEKMCIHGVDANYHRKSREYSREGYYVLALGYKIIKDFENSFSKMSRDDAESNLSFLSFILFRNDIKPESTSTISALKVGKIRPVMVTGDSSTTAFHIAKKCGMFETYPTVPTQLVVSSSNESTIVSTSRPVLLASVGSEGVMWCDMETNEPVDCMQVYCGDKYTELIVPSDAFHMLRTMRLPVSPLKTLAGADEMVISALDCVLMRIRIFSRMNPEDKVLVVQACMDQGYVTGMCGDGSNDCGALKVAHAGISFSDLALFGLVDATMPEMGYVYVDCFILIGLSKAMTLSRPNSKLQIRSPTSSLLGATTILSLGSIVLVDVLFLCVLFAKMSSFGLRSSFDYNAEIPVYAWWMKSDNYEAPCVCIWLCFQLINAAFVFSLGGEFRLNVFRNIWLTITCLSLTVGLLFLVISPPTKFSCLFRINCTDEISRSVNVPFLKLISITARGMPFWGEHGNNILSVQWKGWFLGINAANALTNIFISKYVIFGVPAKYFREKYRSKNSADFIMV
ncbi:E1-E2 ATPase subfamily protein [Cardiosporidium cionae]|uniref:E1-E2 ATPase subfamily protein n=1 Tax=Cardiosporidium cionae TaxID=476202 RepID=A0ABQ7JEN1_9APIC|nr:E1-E2 ATPase subfamily protein [Cardiosporidium cionae]|eukprot:KAF8822471.1 E1-E2 ATPase subfamily protein [Cardiosporidium cionae]